jgi:transcription termination/antitermination protein NusA
VRLAAKLLGWKIDIKSEEEKRQEVESQMAALVSPGAPVSVLMDYGLAENIAEALVGAGIGAIDQLGSMTPEQLEEIQGIVPDSVEHIQAAINAYYAQFDEQPAADAASAETTQEVAQEEVQMEVMEEEGAPPAAEAADTEAEGGGEAALPEESGTIGNAGSPNHSASEAGGEQENRGE